MVFVSHQISPAAELIGSKPKARLLLLPPVSGLRRPLNSRLLSLAAFMSSHAYAVTILEFAGQNGRSGAYSVKNSCDALKQYTDEIASERDETILLFGICSGALAALHAAAFCPTVGGVFCWELSPFYQYSPTSAAALNRRFGLHIDWTTVLTPIQPMELLSRITQPVTFGFSNLSGVTTVAEQTALAEFTHSGSVIRVDGVGHFLGVTAESGRDLTTKLIFWGEQCVRLRNH